jgi:hypothetical protein
VNHFIVVNLILRTSNFGFLFQQPLLNNGCAKKHVSTAIIALQQRNGVVCAASAEMLQAGRVREELVGKLVSYLDNRWSSIF